MMTAVRIGTVMDIMKTLLQSPPRASLATVSRATMVLPRGSVLKLFEDSVAMWRTSLTSTFRLCVTAVNRLFSVRSVTDTLFEVELATFVSMPMVMVSEVIGPAGNSFSIVLWTTVKVGSEVTIVLQFILDVAPKTGSSEFTALSPTSLARPANCC